MYFSKKFSFWNLIQAQNLISYQIMCRFIQNRVAKVATLEIIFDVFAIADICDPTCWIGRNASPIVADGRRRSRKGGHTIAI